MADPLARQDARPPEQIRQQYEIERELARRLMTADRSARKNLYTEAYDELYRRAPQHRKLTQKATADEEAEVVERQLRWLRPFLSPDSVFLEVGAGDCLVTFAVARLVRRAIAVEVSRTMTESDRTPDNFELVISDGTSIPVPPGSVDFAYSQQVMEHLHPDDAREQLANIHAALKPGGRYACVTPNRISGPHDISRHYDDVATCLHLREYSAGELARIFREVGFSRVSLCVATSESPREIPVWPVRVLEGVLDPLPRPLRMRAAALLRPRVLVSFRLLGTK
jgi:SAM-dependent methyltransferase